MFQALNNGVKRMGGFGAVVTAMLNNISRVGADINFYVGDNWLISVVGPPNTTVWVSGGKNGASAMTQMGVTDPSGNFVLTGKMDGTQVGTWTETWMVGSQSATPIVFTVAQPPSGVQQQATQGTQQTQQATVTNPLSSLLDLQLFGFPAWMVAIGGFAAFKLLSKR